ncbi:MAG: c-type cytochrome [Gammaproteobacteria bacterium]|nr:c-type cytochrome [Gammaproteobacteria bacterium]
MNEIPMRMALSTAAMLLLALASANAAPSAYEGRGLYVSYCLVCHGTGGKGDGPLAQKMAIEPANLTTTVRSRSDTILKKIITGQGRQTITGRDRHNLLSDAMPKWHEVFSEEQLDSLIAYLRFLTRKQHDLMGDPRVGEQLYQAYCQSCHGEEGDGNGIMTDLLRINPMDHTNPNVTNALSNEQLLDAILNGKGRYMPGWKGILDQKDAEALVSYIRLLSQ